MSDTTATPEAEGRVWPVRFGRWNVRQIDARTGEIIGAMIFMGFEHRIDAEIDCLRKAARSVWSDHDYVVVDNYPTLGPNEPIPFS